MISDVFFSKESFPMLPEESLCLPPFFLLLLLFILHYLSILSFSLFKYCLCIA